MQSRTGLARAVALFLLTCATCLIPLGFAWGQCNGGAPPAKTDEKPAPACGGAALPAPPPAEKTAQASPVSGGAQDVDLAGYFKRLEPDASLWYQHVGTLASPAFEGRAPGTRGIELAAEYIEFNLRAAGLEPVFPEAGGSDEGTAPKTYRQPLTVDGALPGGYEGMGMLEIDGHRLVAGQDFVITANARQGVVRGPVSFVGYGIERGEGGYTSFDDGVDLHGRVALLLRLEPLDKDGGFLWNAQPGQHASLVNKLNAVASRGAAGVLIVNPPGAKSPVQTLDPLSAVAGGCTALPGIPTAMITPDVANRLLKKADPKSRGLMSWRRQADQGKVRTVDLDADVVVSLETHITAQKVTTENVAGVLPGRGSLKDSWLVIGGHYDALGAGHAGPSVNAGAAIPLGADDNASGTAAVLLLAQRLASAYREAPPDATLRSVVLVAYTAEERGLSGSRYFVQHPPVPLDRVYAALNLDMIGRVRENMLWLTCFGTAAEFDGLFGALLPESGLRVTTQPGSSGSDQDSFLEAGIPALHFFTGGHDELHSPADLAGTINPGGAVQVIDLSEKIAMRLAQRAEPLTFVDQSKASGPGCGARPPADADPSTASSPGCGARPPVESGQHSSAGTGDGRSQTH